MEGADPQAKLLSSASGLGSKVLYEHSWLNRQEEPVPSNSAVANRMKKKLRCISIPKPGEGKLKIRRGKNKEFDHQSKESFLSASRKLPLITE